MTGVAVGLARLRSLSFHPVSPNQEWAICAVPNLLGFPVLDTNLNLPFLKTKNLKKSQKLE
jgi:hypothetical protein